MKIIIAPDSRLNQIAADIKSVDKAVQLILDKMLDCMYENNGIGLAAPQVGLLERLVVLDCALGDNIKKPIKLINPEIIKFSENIAEYEEGCLSLPDHYANVLRPESVIVQYRNVDGKTCKKKFEGIEGTCVQHEIDHLNGKLFVDHISKLRKQIILKKLKKLKNFKSKI